MPTSKPSRNSETPSDPTTATNGSAATSIFDDLNTGTKIKSNNRSSTTIRSSLSIDNSRVRSRASTTIEDVIRQQNEEEIETAKRRAALLASEEKALSPTDDGEVIDVADDAAASLYARLQLFATDEDLVWFKKLYDLSQVPGKWDPTSCGQNSKILASLYCLAAASYLYVKGGAKKEEVLDFFGLFQLNLYQVGGVYVNAVQNYYFCIKMIDAFLNEVWNNKIAAFTAAFFAIFSTAVFAISAYQVSDDSEEARIGEGIMNATGNYPQFWFGIYMLMKSLKKLWSDNPVARKFVLNHLRDQFKDDASLDQLRLAIRRDSSELIKWILALATPFVSTALTMSLDGYYAGTVHFWLEKTGIIPAHFISGFAISPMAGISLGLSGPYITKRVIDKVEDIGFYVADTVTGQARNQLDTREKVLYSGLFIMTAITIYMALYSGETSKYQEETYTPNPLIEGQEWFNTFLEICAEQFAEGFNAAAAVLAIDDLCELIKYAYVVRSSDKHAEYIVERMAQNTLTMPQELIEEIAQDAGMEVPQQYRRNYFFQWPKSATPDAASSPTADEVYRTMANSDDSEEDENNNTSCCLRMGSREND